MNRDGINNMSRGVRSIDRGDSHGASHGAEVPMHACARYSTQLRRNETRTEFSLSPSPRN
jgi:hypothetical protein